MIVISKPADETTIQSLIISLFPIHPLVINDSVHADILTRIHEMLKSATSELKSKVEKAEVFSNLVEQLERLREVRDKHFKPNMNTPHWWPSPNTIYLSDRVPKTSHAFSVKEELFLFEVEENTLSEGEEERKTKKFYFLSEEPIKVTYGIVHILFQVRTPRKNERAEFGKQAKQDQINTVILNTLKELIRELKISTEGELKEIVNTFSYHLSIFTQVTKPIMVYRDLVNLYTNHLENVLIPKPKLTPNNRNKHIPSDTKQVIPVLLGEILDLLTSYEDLIISIWSKKCLVSQTEYIISLDRLTELVGADFVRKITDSILSNENQIQEWMDLYKIDRDILKTQIREPMHQKPFPLDTQYFDASFKWKLLNALPDIPIYDLLDGYVYRSDNWFALNSLKAIWQNKIKCIYIDPPYNTGNEDFIYKDNYSRHEWMVMLRNRLEVAKNYLSEDGVIIISIDDNEMSNLKLLLDEIFEENLIGPIIVQTNPRGRTLDKHLAKSHEYLLIYARNKDHDNTLFQIPKNEEQLAEYNKTDEKGRRYRLIELRNRNPRFNRVNRPNLFYPLFTNNDSNKISLTQSKEFPIEILPKTSKDQDDCWTWSKEKTEANLDILESKKVSTGAWRIFRRNYLENGGNSSTTKEKSIWIEKNLSNERGREQLRDLFGKHTHDYPKSVNFLERIIQLAIDKNQLIMDFFAGSGTTAHATMSLNQKNRINNKFILIEKSNQVNNVILLRIKKLSYSYQWKDGYPVKNDGKGIFIQYQKLEQPIEEFFTRIQVDALIPGRQILHSFQNLKIKSKAEITNPFTSGDLLGIDIINSLNLLLGLNPSTIKIQKNQSRKYLLVSGNVRGKKSLIVWRDIEDIDFDQDKQFLTKLIAKEKPYHIFLNNYCKLESYAKIEGSFRIFSEKKKERKLETSLH